MHERPKVSSLLNTLANYNATIPAVADADAKPAKVSHSFDFHLILSCVFYFSRILVF